MNRKHVMVSGGFDPLHLGHVNLFTEARKLGDRLDVIVNSDEYVARKHRVLMPQYDRAQIIRQLNCVDSTVLNMDGGVDGDVSSDLRMYRPNVFAVGPDYADLSKLPELETCRELGITVVCLRGLVKQSSTALLAKAAWVNPPVTVSALIVQDGMVLLCKRGHADGNGLLQLPGGFLEVGESLEQCLLREIGEELGVVATCLEFLLSMPDVYSDGRQITSVVFRAALIGEPQPSPEAPELIWVDHVPSAEQFFAVSDFRAVLWHLEGGLM